MYVPPDLRISISEPCPHIAFIGLLWFSELQQLFPQVALSIIELCNGEALCFLWSMDRVLNIV
jgi:hypothetical protein